MLRGRGRRSCKVCYPFALMDEGVEIMCCCGTSRLMKMCRCYSKVSEQLIQRLDCWLGGIRLVDGMDDWMMVGETERGIRYGL